MGNGARFTLNQLLMAGPFYSIIHTLIPLTSCKVQKIYPRRYCMWYLAESFDKIFTNGYLYHGAAEI